MSKRLLRSALTYTSANAIASLVPILQMPFAEKHFTTGLLALTDVSSVTKTHLALRMRACCATAISLHLAGLIQMFPNHF